MRARRIRLLLLATLTLGVPVSGCAGDGEEPPSDALSDDAVTVASFDFTESEILAELYSQALEAQGVEVIREFGLGPRELVAPALAAGLVELVPEYAGTAVGFLSLGAVAPTADGDDTHAALVDILAGEPIKALAHAPGEDTNAFIVTPETARRFALRRISDLVRVAPTLTLGGPPECRERPLCFAGLEDVYKVRFGEFVPLDAAGPRTRQALRGGYVDVAVLFSTDPTIIIEGWVELEDDRSLQPSENVTPLVRTEIIERWGEPLVDAIDSVTSRLSTEDLRRLNGAVASGFATPAEAARRWLERQVEP